MSRMKYKDGKYIIQGNKADIKQKDMHSEKMKSHLGDYDSVLKNIDKKINGIDDDDSEADAKEQRLRARKDAIMKMRRQQRKTTK